MARVESTDAQANHSCARQFGRKPQGVPKAGSAPLHPSPADTTQ